MIRVKNLSFGVHAVLSDLPPLLLVQGLLSSRNHWLPNTDALRSRFRLVIAELPGHGRPATCRGPECLHPDALADELDKARQILSIDRWFVCGQSFAAGITLRHTIRHPEAVIARVWTNGNRVLAADPDASDLEQFEARSRALEVDGVEALRRERFHPRHGINFPPQLREQLSRDADGCDLATIAALIRHCLPHANAQRYWQNQHAKPVDQWPAREEIPADAPIGPAAAAVFGSGRSRGRARDQHRTGRWVQPSADQLL